MKNIIRLISDEDGQGTAEYAIIMAAIVVVAIIAINAIGGAVRDNLNNSANKINTL